MTNQTQVEVAGTPAPVALADAKPEAQNTPQATAAEGEVVTQEQAQEQPKTFTQAEVDALIQKRLRKAEQRFSRQIQETLTKSQPPQEAPQREAFVDDEQFMNARIEHEAEQRAQRKLDERQKREQQERVAEGFREKAEKASERYPDFQSVVGDPRLPINAAMAEYIADSELGADVAYFLGKNPDRAGDIAEMSPVRAARELARIEAELAAKPKATPSNAPEPIKPVGTRGKASASSLPSDDDDIDTWMQKERVRMRAR